jgi:hypothetical protein
MDNLLIHEETLVEVMEKFDQLRALFDVLEDDTEAGDFRPYQLATIGRNLAFEASRTIGKLIDEAKALQARKGVEALCVEAGAREAAHA